MIGMVVVNVHGLGTAPDTNALPAKSVAAVVIVAVYWSPAVRLAVGVKVAIVFEASMVTVPGTLVPLTVSLSVNVSNAPGVAETIVAGTIALLNVAVTLLLIATFMARSAGTVSVTVGAVSGAIHLSVSPPCPPHPAITTLRINIINVRQACKALNLFI
jgi:hypothetical protein